MEKKSKVTTEMSRTGKIRGDESNALFNPSAHQSMFVSMAIEMSWQLAIVVIIPIVGGFLLDSIFNTTPILTLIGLLVAAVGVIGVLKRILAIAERQNASDRSGESKKVPYEPTV